MQNILKLCILFFIGFGLLACSKISEDNFKKIKSGMRMDQVVAMLGKPTSAENVTVAGIAGTSAVWKDKYGEIDIHFLDNKVAVKSFNKNEEEKSFT